jgi:ferredoxin
MDTHCKKTHTESENLKQWYAAYEVPAAARGIIDLILTEKEQQLIAAFIGETFSAADARKALGSTDDGESRELLDSAYRRGVISIAGESLYKINNFFSRLGIVSVNERNIYLSIPEETRSELEALYFDRYYDGLDWNRDGGRPTADTVITLDETLAILEEKDAEGKDIYRTNCDCRSLRNGCDHLKDVCITFVDGTNTWPDRGIAEKVSVEKASEIIIAADKDGLIHTLSPHGICNCCTDCCYLFRSKEKHDSGRVWPASNRIVYVGADECVGCGLCVKRCPFGALSLAADGDELQKNKIVVRDDKACIGCGLCISSCNFDALSLHVA